ncbi:MAG: type III-A CRISPR-associated protein Csm2 [Bacteroidota bacterium]
MKNYGKTTPSTKNSSEKQQKLDWEREWRNEWITHAPDDKMITFCDKIAKYLKEKKLTTNQIRNFFSEVVRIKENGILKNRTEFLMLKPKIAYAAKRAGEEGAFVFQKIMTKAIELTYEAENDQKLQERFKNFHALFEAILAYHKVHGGK